MRRHSLFTSNSKFLLKLFVLLGIVIVFCFHVSGQFEDEYTAALIDKVERLDSIEGPKIVLLGNSNLSFGIQSELIEREFGVSVVNMGLHGGLGNMFHEEMARLNVCEGDIYVLCHATFNDPNVIVDPVLAWTTVEKNFTLYKIFRKEDVIPLIKAYPTYLKKCLKRYSEEHEPTTAGTVYSRDAFNKYGDIEINRDDTEFEVKSELNIPKISKDNIGRINELTEWLAQRGATLVVAGFPIAMGSQSPLKEEYVQFQKELEDVLLCEVISDYTDYMYGYECFYDSEYHLLSEYAEDRTYQLINDLKKWKQFSEE